MVEEKGVGGLKDEDFVKTWLLDQLWMEVKRKVSRHLGNTSQFQKGVDG